MGKSRDEEDPGVAPRREIFLWGVFGERVFRILYCRAGKPQKRNTEREGVGESFLEDEFLDFLGGEGTRRGRPGRCSSGENFFVGSFWRTSF